MTEAGERTPADAPRVAGHCVVCNAMVVRMPDGSCPNGHAAGAVTGHIALAEGAPLPELPRFNWGAFLIPPVWGVAHGLWAGVFFLPLWAFVDNAIRGTQGRALWMQALAWGTLVGTLTFQYEYARTANRLVWRRAAERMDLEHYVRRERIWAIGGVVVVATLAGWVGTYLSR